MTSHHAVNTCGHTGILVRNAGYYNSFAGCWEHGSRGRGKRGDATYAWLGLWGHHCYSITIMTGTSDMQYSPLLTSNVDCLQDRQPKGFDDYPNCCSAYHNRVIMWSSNKQTKIHASNIAWQSKKETLSNNFTSGISATTAEAFPVWWPNFRHLLWRAADYSHSFDLSTKNIKIFDCVISARLWCNSVGGSRLRTSVGAKENSAPPFPLFFPLPSPSLSFPLPTLTQ